MALHMIDCLKDLQFDRFSKYGRLEKLPSGTRFAPAASMDKRSHDFTWHNKFWMCKICFVRVQTIANAKGSCNGPPLFKGLLEDNMGHTLWTAAIEGGGIILYCSKCFYYASPFPGKLARPCTGHPAAFSSDMFYLSRRNHPVSFLALRKPVQLHV